MPPPSPPPSPAPVAAALRSRLGDRVVVDPDVLVGYERDRSALTPAGRPAAAVRARDVDDVVATLQVASAAGVAVVTRGSGTGLAGGANGLDGCVVLSTAAMDRILAIDEVGRTATVEAGVLNGDLAAAVAARGLWYPPDPASRAISTIGGNVATNAGGACCLKYGVTGDHVAGLVAVLADGTVIRTGAAAQSPTARRSATRKDVAGLDLTRLLVGSEGTLAVVVEVVVRLRPATSPPATLVASFASLAAAAAAVLAVQRVAEPSLLELMDRTTIRAVEAMTRMDLDVDAGALVLAQSDAAAAGEDIARAAAACTAAGATYVATTADPAEGELLLAARRAAYPALERLGATLLEDLAVPPAALPAVITAVEGIAARHGVVIGTFGHAGDGNLHPTIVFDPADGASTAAARAAFDDVVRATLAAGGSITGEHGVGSLKVPYLDAAVGGAERALMARIKAAFDPAGTLNPGRGL